MSARHCANCGMELAARFEVRYCGDCWRMSRKTVYAQVLATLVLVGLRWLIGG
jgi:hypothetical protein